LAESSKGVEKFCSLSHISRTPFPQDLMTAAAWVRNMEYSSDSARISYYQTRQCSKKWGVIFTFIVIGFFVINVFAYQHLLEPYCRGKKVDQSMMLALSFAYVPDTFFAVGSGLAAIDQQSPLVLLNILNSVAGGLLILGIIASGFENFSDFFEHRFNMKTRNALTVIFFAWTAGIVPCFCCFVNGTTYYQAIYYAFTVGFTSGMTNIDDVDDGADAGCDKLNLYAHGVITYISVVISTSWASAIGGKFYRMAEKVLFPKFEENQQLLEEP